MAEQSADEVPETLVDQAALERIGSFDLPRVIVAALGEEMPQPTRAAPGAAE